MTMEKGHDMPLEKILRGKIHILEQKIKELETELKKSILTFTAAVKSNNGELIITFNDLVTTKDISGLVKQFNEKKQILIFRIKKEA